MIFCSWLIAAALAISVVEYFYKLEKYSSFVEVIPFVIVPIVIGQVCLYYGFRNAPSLFIAGAFFSLAAILLRIVNTYWLGGNINLYNWCGIVLLFVSLMLLKIK